MDTNQAFQHLYKTYFGDLQIEKEEIENLPNILSNCDVFIDVGASLGMFTYYANKILNNSKIIAVEADPDRYVELTKNCIKWEKLSTNKIIAIHSVIGEKRKPVKFYKTGTNISGGLFPVDERSEFYKPVEIPQITLDEFFEKDKRFVIKIDVEGAEYRVMQGAENHIKNRMSKFLIEFHWWGDRDKGTTSIDLLKFLYINNLSIEKTVKIHTSNYLLKPITTKKDLLTSYLRYSPLLIAKTIYGKYIPKSIRNFREKRLNRIRSSKFQ